MMRAMKGRRTIIAFGNLRHLRLLNTSNEKTWTLVASEDAARWHADQGDPYFEELVQVIDGLLPDELYFRTTALPP
jgi:hypothetical protein